MVTHFREDSFLKKHCNCLRHPSGHGTSLVGWDNTLSIFAVSGGIDEGGCDGNWGPESWLLLSHAHCEGRFSQRYLYVDNYAHPAISDKKPPGISLSELLSSNNVAKIPRFKQA